MRTRVIVEMSVYWGLYSYEAALEDNPGWDYHLHWCAVIARRDHAYVSRWIPRRDIEMDAGRYYNPRKGRVG